MKTSLLLLILVALLGSVQLTGCGTDSGGSSFALEDVNVLLIVIDTMGSGHVGAWNDGLDTSPNIDALAAGGVRFDRAYSASPWTQPAVASLITGRTPSRHGVLHLLDTLPEGSSTIARALSERGFRTSGVISHFLINRKQGYAQGFETYDETAVGGHETISSPEVTRKAIREMRRLRDERFFLFVHYFDPHSEYNHHEEFDRTSGYEGKVRQMGRNILELRAHRGEMDEQDVAFLRGLYREEIAFTDLHVGKLLDALKNLELEKDTLVILTADHGEEFMEHDWIGHTRFLYDTLVQVPLVISLPGRLEPRVVDAPVHLNDIMPTLMDFSRDPSGEADWDGLSLKGLLTGGPAVRDRPLFTEVSFLAPADEQGTPTAEKEAFLAAVSLDRWKLIHDLDRNLWTLFDRRDDPLEMKDLYREDHEQVQLLQPLLLDWEKGKVETWGRTFADLPRMSEEQRRRLKSLGYIR